MAAYLGLAYRTFTIEELEAEADIKPFKSIVGNPAHLLYQLLHTDQLNIHYKIGVICSSYHPQYN